MLDFLFGDKIKQALRRKATIIDVRTVHEYDQGRIPGSVNIPLDRIPASIQRIEGMQRPIILVSATGSQAAAAIRILKQHGLKELYNGGNWERVLKKINTH